MSESRLCDHGFVYGCPECAAENAAAIQRSDPSEASGRAPQPQPVEVDWIGVAFFVVIVGGAAAFFLWTMFAASQWGVR